mmetsp:Transcript_26718/g.49027  ORF Transcript_26718/g.49027 Transcript_26718/m.49027 type:complete len:210 (+) Transcript_26718:526-1155(+)
MALSQARPARQEWIHQQLQHPWLNLMHTVLRSVSVHRHGKLEEAGFPAHGSHSQHLRVDMLPHRQRLTQRIGSRGVGTLWATFWFHLMMELKGQAMLELQSAIPTAGTVWRGLRCHSHLQGLLAVMFHNSLMTRSALQSKRPLQLPPMSSSTTCKGGSDLPPQGALHVRAQQTQVLRWIEVPHGSAWQAPGHPSESLHCRIVLAHRAGL